MRAAVPRGRAARPAGRRTVPSRAQEGRLPTRRGLLAEVAGALEEVAGEEGPEARRQAAAEARWLVEHVVGARGADFSLSLDEPVSPAELSAARGLVARRRSGEPLQYVLGRWAFRHLDLIVDRRVLIPRPETEQVAGAALAEMWGMWEERTRSAGGSAGGPAGARGPGLPGAGVPARPLRVVDLGTGSGAIALSLATEGPPGTEVWATDASGDALVTARANVADVEGAHPGVAGRVHVLGGTWFEALPAALRATVDVIVANPPYVSEDELPGLDAGVREWEPRRALVAVAGSVSGAVVGGFADIEAIVRGAPAWLARPGVLVVEMDPAQVAPASDLARQVGFTGVVVVEDLAGRPRAVVGRI